MPAGVSVSVKVNCGWRSEVAGDLHRPLVCLASPPLSPLFPPSAGKTKRRKGGAAGERGRSPSLTGWNILERPGDLTGSEGWRGQTLLFRNCELLRFSSAETLSQKPAWFSGSCLKRTGQLAQSVRKTNQGTLRAAVFNSSSPLWTEESGTAQGWAVENAQKRTWVWLPSVSVDFGT